jgi:uncharacterized RDD family membrane protein YckC
VNPFDPLERVLGVVVPRAVDAVDMDEVLQSVDVDEVIGRVDADALIERVDVDKVIKRIDVADVVRRVDIDDVIGRMDVDDVIRRIDVDDVIARVDVDKVIERVDVDKVIGRVDVNDVVQRVDIEAVLAGVDLDTVLARVDTNALLDRIDVNALLGKIDPEVLLARIDPDALMERIDVNALISRVDVDALIARVDVEAVVQRANIDSIVREASMGVFGRGIDLVRRQLVGLDLLLISAVARVLRRPRETPSFASGTVTGKVGGGVSRFAAFVVDAFTLSLLYGLFTSLVIFGLERIFGYDRTSSGNELVWGLGYVAFGFLYYWIGLSLTGRSIGKGLLGLRVIRMDGGPIHPGQAAVRTIVYPFSFILGLGLLPIVFARSRRALHDKVSHTHVVYDWGDRPAELPAPVTRFIQRSLPDEPAEEVLGRRFDRRGGRPDR